MTSSSRLRRALRDLDVAVGRPSASTLAGLARGRDERLPRSTLYELRRQDSSRVPSWRTVLAFVRACLAHAEETSAVVPDPLTDLQHWRRLHDECADRGAGGTRNVAIDAGGSVLQARDIHGDVHVHAPDGEEPRRRPAVRSAYLEQVARLAPDVLHDRDDELAELAAWCASDDHGASYRWWQASAWAGKSALMSWLVLHPPPGVRVVSFFVTARLSSQNNKTAFAEVVLEQVAEILGQPLPELLTDATRDAHLLRLLAQAATTCRERGERLVLVVDGLDEDRGVTVGPDGHSIAALLPARPIGGLRVVVAGRPDPPIPADVPERHPLRDKRVVRRLERSEHADVVRVDAQRELNHLLRGTPAERDLLGVVAAAGGGLSGRDLADLTGWPAWEVEEQLRAVSGRTFSRRTVHWGPDSAPCVYLLAHEQLQQDAIRMLGEARVAGYRQRLHLWADRYRERGWPIGTPEYLLRGYFWLLRELGETSRLVGCALDRSRHERMLDLTGGDSAALIEIAGAQDAVDGQDPDLSSMIRLVIYRAELSDRNFLIPPGLPEAWTRLGHHARAEALAWSLPDQVQRTRALTTVVEAVASTGDEVGAASIARTIEQPPVLGEPPALELNRRKRWRQPSPDLVADAITAGKLSHALALAQRIPRGVERWEALGRIVRAVARTGDIAKAEAIVTTIHNPRWRARSLTDLVIPVAETGDTRRAEDLATGAERLARISHPLAQRPDVVMAVLRAVVATGDLTRAEKLADTLEVTGRRGHATSELVALMSARQELDRAEAIARAITDPFWRGRALISVHRAAVGGGALAGRTAGAVLTAVRAIRLTRERAEVCAGLSAGLAEHGDVEQAEALARSIGYERLRAQALLDVTVAVARRGDVDRAGVVAATIADADLRALAVIAVASAVAHGGDAAWATAMADGIADPRWRTRALTELAVVEAANGNRDAASRLSVAAEALASTIAFTAQRAAAMSETVTAVAASGDITKAESLAKSIAVPRWRDRAVAELVSVVADDVEKARPLADTIGDPDLKARALVSIASRSDDTEARALIASVLRLRRWTATLDVLARIEPEVVLAVCDGLLGEQA
ncbi:hypothetical protein ACFFQW_15365 [Umezawaea endophytica]|uniref:Nephrocystin 3-like N-terminal domain-containing protein n=1 Tax=Umezawaea endophytica TaxID=1654476 RepID=A0A9X2VG06_9PSEU|nr:hypothetical protein [Umezawaea endophytica]MCS7475449.1 hypothetical protein [Umezawaea endophytica]